MEARSIFQAAVPEQAGSSACIIKTLESRYTVFKCFGFFGPASRLRRHIPRAACEVCRRNIYIFIKGVGPKKTSIKSIESARIL